MSLEKRFAYTIIIICFAAIHPSMRLQQEVRESIRSPNRSIIAMRWLLLPTLSDKLTCRIVSNARRRSTISNQTQIGVARHQLLMLLVTSTAMRARAGHNMIHHTLQLAVHQRVLWRVRLKWVRVKAMWLIGCGVELSVEKTGRQHRINWTVASAIATVATVSVLILIKVLISTIRAAQIGCVWRQQVVLHGRFSLRWVAQASRSILTCVQVVVICAAIVVSEQIVVVRRAIGERLVVVAVICCNISRVHQRLMTHLRLGWRRSNETGQVLIEICCCRVRQHYRRLNLVVKASSCVKSSILTWNAIACTSKVLRCLGGRAWEAKRWIVELRCSRCGARAGEAAARQVWRICWGWTVAPVSRVGGTQAELRHVCLNWKKRREKHNCLHRFVQMRSFFLSCTHLQGARF